MTTTLMRSPPRWRLLGAFVLLALMLELLRRLHDAVLVVPVRRPHVAEAPAGRPA